MGGWQQINIIFQKRRQPFTSCHMKDSRNCQIFNNLKKRLRAPPIMLNLIFTGVRVGIKKIFKNHKKIKTLNINLINTKEI